MTHLSDDDMIWLNALADDELVGADKELWLERINKDADAKAVYDSILSLKSNLKNYTINMPSTENRAGILPVNRTVNFGKAASFLFVLLLGGASVLWFGMQSKPPLQTTVLEDVNADLSPSSWHAKLSKSNYDLSTISSPKLRFALDKPYLKVPDLRPTGLVLVATKLLSNAPEKQVQLLHYIGSRGCRLTLWYGPISQTQNITNNQINSKQWTVKDTQVWVFATGMDPNRFASITDYIQIYNSPKQPMQQQLLASKNSMGQVYRDAESCT